MSKILVIDDDRTIVHLVTKALCGGAVEVAGANDAETGMQLLRESSPDVLFLDIMLPDANGLELASQIRAFDPKLPVVFITASEDSGVAIEAMKLGAYDYVLKPLGVEQIQSLTASALETRRLMRAPVSINQNVDAPDGDVLIGRSPQMLEVYKQIGRVAGQDVAVMIRGESGTGKELIARALYQHGGRSEACFLAVNCAALSNTLLESELFGHEKGAFTGAERRHVGKFEQCRDGTIFLDEVGDMSPLTQSKVLRLIQEQQFERVGGSETIQVDVRIISATNRDLEAMIDDGEYRLDLFHRLNAFEIDLPPLQKRGDDTRLLLEHFLAKFNTSLSKSITGISNEAIELLLQYAWPGNIRELQTALRKAMLMATGPILVPDNFPDTIQNEDAVETSSSDRNSDLDVEHFVSQRLAAGSTDVYAESLEWMERHVIKRILEANDGIQSKAAENLGITRGSLRHKLRSLGLTINQSVDET